jgi:hypothetical protein
VHRGIGDAGVWWSRYSHADVCCVQEYRQKGSKHLYFMNLDADHIIDSTRKGAITRFVNHSCDPNMDLQKWTVNGEPRIGFFASRPIEAGEVMNCAAPHEPPPLPR